jgi:hypothetical protein
MDTLAVPQREKFGNFSDAMEVQAGANRRDLHN